MNERAEEPVNEQAEEREDHDGERERYNRAVDASVDAVLAGADEGDDLDASALRERLSNLVQQAGGIVNALIVMSKKTRTLARQTGELCGRNQKLERMQREILEQIERRPRLARLLAGETLEVTLGDATRRVLPVIEMGRGPEHVQLPMLLSDSQEVPPPLSSVLVDSSGGFFLGAAEVPTVACEEHEVVSVDDNDAPVPGVTEVWVADGPEQHGMRFAPAELADEIRRRLNDGEQVKVRADAAVVHAISGGGVAATPPWLEMLDLDEGLGIEDMVFFRWLRDEWEEDIEDLLAGIGRNICLLGPTGTGKTAGVLAMARSAGRRSGRDVALIRLSMPHIGSSYVSETERTLRAALRRAKKLAADGVLVVVLLDEADALVGNSEGRFEGSHARSVREAFQELVASESCPGVGMYLTLNRRSDSWLPAPIENRFLKRCYPRTSRGQLARVNELYLADETAEHFGTDRRTLGARLADFLFREQFVVARVTHRSGHSVPVRARDLRVCSPGKMKAVLETLNRRVKRNRETTLPDVFTALEREFSLPNLTPANVYEMTFIHPVPNDAVVATPPVEPGTVERADAAG
jgi:hypothetical protein